MCGKDITTSCNNMTALDEGNGIASEHGCRICIHGDEGMDNRYWLVWSKRQVVTRNAIAAVMHRCK
jgi:hypothetical protein